MRWVARSSVLACALALSPLSTGAAWAEGGAAVEVWPSRARTLEDGRVEYLYDLRPLKAGKVQFDPGPDADQAAVAAFLESLPNETRVMSRPEKATLVIDAPGGLEGAPYATSFSRVVAGPFVPASQFDRREDPDGLPALHPGAPKLLPSADLLLWKNDVVQDGVLAGIALATDAGERAVPLGRKALVERLLTAALARYQSSTGTVKDGARRLAVRLGGVLGASTGRIPDALLAIPDLRDEAAEASGNLTRPEPRFPPSPRSYWSPALTAAAIRERALGQPLGTDRQGHAAALTLLAILDADPKLKAAWDAQRDLRDRLLGKPQLERVDDYRAAAKEEGVAAALDDLSGFLARLSSLEEGQGAAIMSRAESPVSRFVDQLHGPEQLQAIDELTLAVQDGRYSLAGPEDEGWAAGRHRWAAFLLRPAAGDAARVFPTGAWRDRLVRTFQALFGLHAEVDSGQADDPTEVVSSHAFKVRLKVPPHLELEPLPEAYAEAALAWTRLDAALKDHRAAAKITGVRPNGARRPQSIAKDAHDLARLYRGLALLSRVSLGEDAARSDADQALVKHARRFLSGWRKDDDLGQDVRYLLPASPTEEDGLILHSGAFGVSRREIEVRFERPPELEIRTSRSEQAQLFIADAEAFQRYQVPVLATGAVQVRRTAPLDIEEFRRICDRAGRTREAIEAALPGAMVRSLQSVSQDVP